MPKDLSKIGSDYTYFKDYESGVNASELPRLFVSRVTDMPGQIQRIVSSRISPDDFRQGFLSLAQGLYPQFGSYDAHVLVDVVVERLTEAGANGGEVDVCVAIMRSCLQSIMNPVSRDKFPIHTSETVT